MAQGPGMTGQEALSKRPDGAPPRHRGKGKAAGSEKGARPGLRLLGAALENNGISSGCPPWPPTPSRRGIPGLKRHAVQLFIGLDDLVAHLNQNFEPDGSLLQGDQGVMEICFAG